MTQKHPSAISLLLSQYESYSDQKTLEALVARVGHIHLGLRLGTEQEKEARVFGQGRTFFHIENWALVGFILKHGLQALQLIQRGRNNARALVVRRNEIKLDNLPKAFDGYTILQISDPHLDMADDIPHALIEAVRDVNYDLCVWTGDFRGKTYGDYHPALEGLQRVRPHLKGDVYAVLGNHDSIRMVPEMEAMDIRLLLNEHVQLRQKNVETGKDESIYLAGIDDPHFYRADNFEKAADDIPREAASILLAHSPEVYKSAAFANFDAMLCGHTHGGQICLPGGWPLILNADCPREYCMGSWNYKQLQGYTSAGSGSCVLDVRYNCPPEITLHELRCGR